LTAEWKRTFQQQLDNLAIFDRLNAVAMQRKETEKEEGTEHEDEDDSEEDHADKFEVDEAYEGAR
jgi:hypothetical protein